MTQHSIFPKIQSLKNNWSHLQHISLSLFQQLKDASDKKLQANIYFKEHQNLKLCINLEIFKKLRDKRFYYHNKSKIDLLLKLNEDSYTWLQYTSDIIKLHYQYGNNIEVPFIGSCKPYVSLTTTRKITGSSFKLGIIKNIQKGFVDLRYRHNISQSQSSNFLYTKIGYDNGLFSFNNLNCLSLSHKILQKNDFWISISPISNHSIGLQLENNEFRNHKINYRRLGSYFDSLKLMYCFNHDDIKAGLLYQYSIEQSQSKKLQIVMKLKDYSIRLNNLLEFGLKSRFRWQRFNIEIGAKWKNAKRNKVPSLINFKICYE